MGKTPLIGLFDPDGRGCLAVRVVTESLWGAGSARGCHAAVQRERPGCRVYPGGPAQHCLARCTVPICPSPGDGWRFMGGTACLPRKRIYKRAISGINSPKRIYKRAISGINRSLIPLIAPYKPVKELLNRLIASNKPVKELLNRLIAYLIGLKALLNRLIALFYW